MDWLLSDEPQCSDYRACKAPCSQAPSPLVIDAAWQGDIARRHLPKLLLPAKAINKPRRNMVDAVLAAMVEAAARRDRILLNAIGKAKGKVNN